MTSYEACATDDFWNLVEAHMKCSIPTYVKNLLKLRGFDNALSVKTLTDDDIKSLETFAQTKMRMFIPPGANHKDYYHMFSAEPESFEILPGHIKMLKEIAKQIDDIIQNSSASVSRSCSEMNHSVENGIQLEHSINENGSGSIEPCESRCSDISHTGVTDLMHQGPITAFIVDGSPEEFYIQLENIQTELDKIGALLEPASTWAVFNKALVGQMCAALFDGNYYRGIILSSDDKGATIHYVDYGNRAIATDLRKLPEKLQQFRHLAISCRLESKNGTFSPQLTERFENLSRDDAYEVKFLSMESNPAIVQLFVDGVLFEEQQGATKSVSVPEINGFEKQFNDIAESNKKLDEILDEMSELVTQNSPATPQAGPIEKLKFVETTPLKDGDFVVIRYVESPTLFSVQQTTSIGEYDDMMDKLCDYCPTAPTILKPEIGMACAAFYQHDSEWFRAEILDIDRDGALTRFVDYGIELTIEINKLREIGNEFLLMPKQAISCCILGFESLKATSTVTDKFEFLAENLNGERRQFRVTTHGMVNGVSLVNLVDVKDKPILDLSMRLLQLSLPQEKFRECRQQLLQKNESATQQSKPSPVSPDSTSDLPLVHDVAITLKGIEIERLFGQTVMAKVVSFRDLNNFQIVICGCEATFDASYHKNNTSVKLAGKTLQEGATIPIQIEGLLLGRTFLVTPMIDPFVEKPASTICNLPFFSNNFKAYVMHWENYNVAYVHSLIAHDLAPSLLDELFDLYDKSGDLLQDLAPGMLCAVKSSDENWYRAEIIAATRAEVNVRYLDYGNCELIPKNLVKRLDPKFLNTPALAVKVYLPLQKVYSDRETAVDENVKLTAGIAVDLKVLEFCNRDWIVDMLINNASITAAIKQKSCCKSMSIDDLKKQIARIETLEKVAQLQAQKERENYDAKPISPVENNVDKDIAPPATSTQPPSTQASTNRVSSPQAPKNQPATDQKSQQINGKLTSKTHAYISHTDRPDRFFLQISSISATLDQLREDIQIVAPSLPPLEDFSIDTRCIVRYSADGQWYRAVIIDSDSDIDAKITSILFIDYGNTDTITDNRLIKSMNDAFDRIPPCAIPCSLPLEPRDRMEWSDEACGVLKNLMDKELEFEYVCKGKSNNFVKLYHEHLDIMQEMIWGGHAIKLESIKSGTYCHASYVNSISDFYIQMESDVDTLRKVAGYLLDVSKFEIMKDIKEGVICAAKYSSDGLWYRAKILSRKANSTEVFFIDHGYTTLTKEIRILPDPVGNAPAIAKHCSMVKPKDITYWSDNAERRFVELTDNGSYFIADVITPGKQSTIDLFFDTVSILEALTPLCDKYSTSQLEAAFQDDDDAELFKAYIVLGSPSKFYIQLECDSKTLDEMWHSLSNAYKWPALKQVAVGQMCAAVFDGNYYRAKILSLGEGGAHVHYVDYGNQSFSTDLRILPENIKQHRHLSSCCRLESKYTIASSKLIENFEKLSRDDTYEVRFISKGSSPAVVQLFVQGKKF